jgi:integrase
MILGEAVRRGLVGQNAARGINVKRPRQDGKRQRLARRAEIPPIAHLKLLIEAAERLSGDDPRLPIMLLVVMLAGLRASELRGFAWPGANLGVSANLTVAQRADRWNDIGPPKSDAGYRTIPIGPMLVRSLKAWKLRCPPSPLNLMFPATRRDRRWSSDRAELGFGPIKQGALSGLFLKVQIEAELALDTGRKDTKSQPVWKSRYGWHDLRHVAASNWLNDGIDLKRLQTWIGHENIQLTIDVYGHLMADAKKDAALAASAEAALLA